MQNELDRIVDEEPHPPLPGAAPPEASAFEKTMAMFKSLLLRAMVIYFVMSFIRGNNSPVTVNKDNIKVGMSGNAWSNWTEFSLYVYVSESENFNSNDKLLWKQDNLLYGDWLENSGGIIEWEGQITLGESAKNNGSLYIHTLAVPRDKTHEIYSHKLLNKFKKKKIVKTKNLLSGNGAAIEEEETPVTVTSHYHPNLTINLVTDWTGWTKGAVPVPLNDYIKFTQDQKYLPVLFYNDYWNFAKDYNPVGKMNSTLPLRLTYQPLSLFKWQLYAAQSVRSHWAGFMENDEDDTQDTLKETMIETSPVLLGLTFAVSLLHSVFEFLAFKNDIQFWNNRKSLEGLSVRSVFFNVFQALIVLLYVLDNETNFVIKASCFIGLLIEIWKINKVTDIKIVNYRITMEDKQTYSQSPTKVYDKLAFKYLSILCFPLLFCYSVYSLIYHEHKGFYSFTLSVLYGYLLTFGFIMMTPQLFINYKLKSVAHLPWRMLSYKFLNTFIDDIFAFVIKMPMMYRIGCLRDDVVFFVYLWQRWVYRTDYARVNEYGWVGEGGDGDSGGAEGVVASAIENVSQDKVKNE